MKNEPRQVALARVAQDELGLSVAALPQTPELLGAYEHFYPDSFAGSAGQVGVSTHYVVLGHVLHLPADFAVPSCDAQHAELRWWPLADALASDRVHGSTKDYLVGLEALVE